MLDAVKQFGDDMGHKVDRKSKESATGLDFLPEGYLDGRRRRRSNTLMLVLFIIVVGMVGTTFSLAEKQLAATEAQRKAVDEEYAAAARRIEQVRELRQKQKTIADRVELTTSLLEKLPRTNVLAELTNSLPPGVSLTDLSLDAKRLDERRPQTSFEQKTGVPQPPQPLRFSTTLEISGIAYTESQVSDYIAALSKSEYLSAVDLKWVKMGSGPEDVMRSFLLSLTLNPEAEARPHRGTRVTSVTALPQDQAPPATSPGEEGRATGATAHHTRAREAT